MKPEASDIHNRQSAVPGNQDAVWVGLLIALLGFILLLRIISLYYNNTNLFFDEAQYWLWGKEPAFGYFSKPPLLGWIIGATTALCGSDSEFCVRLPAPIMHTITAVFIYLSAARLFDRRTGFWAGFIYITLPGITLSSTLISTDVALLLFWSAGFWALQRFLGHATWTNAIILGLIIGLGLMSKYAMAYFFMCAFLLALFDKSAREAIFSLKILLAVLVSILILSPNLWWNAQHEFITASHTGDNIGWRGDGLHFDKMAEFLGSQFGVFGPVLFGIYVVTLFRSLFEKFDSRYRALVLFSAPVLVIITIQALMSKAYANWAALTYICATILVADLLCNVIPKFWNRLSTALHVAIFAIISVSVAFSAPGILTLPDGREPFHRLHGWKQISREVEMKLDRAEFSAVIASPRHLTAELVYYLRHRSERVYALAPVGRPHDHYELTRAFSSKEISPVLYVSQTQNPDRLEEMFEKVEPLGFAEIGSGSINKIWFFKLSEYTGNTIGTGVTE